MKTILSAFFASLVLGSLATYAQANDSDLKFSTSDGSTKMSFQNSAGVEVASITSKGDAYFRDAISTASAISYRITADSTTPAATFGSTPLSFNIAVGDIWTFEAYLFFNGPVAGTKVSVNFPAGATARTEVVGCTSAPTIFTSDIITVSNTASTAYAVNISSAIVHMTGTIATPTNAGQVTIQFESNTAAQVSILKGGSYLVARKTSF